MPYKDLRKAKECAERYRKSPAGKRSQKKRNLAYRSNLGNREKIKQCAARYRKTKEGIEAAFRGQLRKYNLTIAEYNLILEKQGGICRFCGEPPRNLRLDVEHDHKCCDGSFSCGACIRGLVHRRCNSFIAVIEKYSKMFQKYKRILR